MGLGYFGGVLGASGGLTAPTPTISVSFTDPFDTPDFVDISRYIKSGTTKRGRQHELQRAVAGTCQLTIMNQDGRFSTFNTTSPYVNVMTGADSYFADQAINSVPGGWANAVNCNPFLVGGQGFDNLPALAVQAVTAATTSASTATGTSGYAVTAGNTYGFMAQFKAAATARTCNVGVGWYNSGGSLIGSVTYGPNVTDATATYTKATLTATAPVGAVTCALFAQVTSPLLAETHYVTRCMISNADQFGNVSPGWAPGGRGLVPARPIKVTASWNGVAYPVFYGYVDSWIPTYGAMLSDQVLNASDGLTLLALSYITTSAYSAQILSESPLGYWPLGDIGPNFADATANGNPLITLASQAGVTYDIKPGALTSDVNGAAGFAPGASALTFSTPYPSGTWAAGFSLECWFQTSLTGIAVMAGVGPTPAFLPFAEIQINTSSVVGVIGLASTSSLAATYDDGKWHHVVITGTSSASASTCKLYVDGTFQSTASTVGVTQSAADVQVGSASNVGTVAPVGFNIDAVALYSTQLSAADIALHYHLGQTGFVQQQSGQRIGAVLQSLGVSASLQSLATGISAVQAPSSTLNTTPALSHIQTVETTEQGFFYVDESGIFTYRDRHYIVQNPAALVSNATFADDDNPAHFNYLIGSLVPAADALDLWNDWPVSAIASAAIGVTGTIQDAPNADSIRAYGKRTQQGYSSMLQTSDAEALSLSQWGVAHYGQPIPRVRQMKLDSTCLNPSSMPQALGRKLLDRITVIRQPIDGTAAPLNQDSLIEDIQHDFAPDLWTTTWGLSVAETQQYFTLNDPVLGKLKKAASPTGNRLGF